MRKQFEDVANTTFDNRITAILQRNQQRQDGQDKFDINWLLMWIASYKGQVEGYLEARDDLRRMRDEGLIDR